MTSTSIPQFRLVYSKELDSYEEIPLARLNEYSENGFRVADSDDDWDEYARRQSGGPEI